MNQELLEEDVLTQEEADKELDDTISGFVFSGESKRVAEGLYMQNQAMLQILRQLRDKYLK